MIDWRMRVGERGSRVWDLVEDRLEIVGGAASGFRAPLDRDREVRRSGSSGEGEGKTRARTARRRTRNVVAVVWQIIVEG